MPVTKSVLEPGVVLTGDSTTVVTATVNTTITAAVFANPTAATVNYAVTVVRSGGVSTNIIPSRAIPTMATNIPQELVGLVLVAGDSLTATGSGATCVISGFTTI